MNTGLTTAFNDSKPIILRQVMDCEIQTQNDIELSIVTNNFIEVEVNSEA